MTFDMGGFSDVEDRGFGDLLSQMVRLGEAALGLQSLQGSNADSLKNSSACQPSSSFAARAKLFFNLNTCRSVAGSSTRFRSDDRVVRLRWGRQDTNVQNSYRILEEKQNTMYGGQDSTV